MYRTDWETPQWLYDELNAEFGFTIDVAADSLNSKCGLYYNASQNALEQPWLGICWCNPPYDKTIARWVKKASESAADGATVVMLLPASTDTGWFHEYVYHKAETRFIKGRLYFGDGKVRAPFGSMIVIFRPTKPGGRH